MVALYNGYNSWFGVAFIVSRLVGLSNVTEHASVDQRIGSLDDQNEVHYSLAGFLLRRTAMCAYTGDTRTVNCFGVLQFH